jgi:hypothetical protein
VHPVLDKLPKLKRTIVYQAVYRNLPNQNFRKNRCNQKSFAKLPRRVMVLALRSKYCSTNGLPLSYGCKFHPLIGAEKPEGFALCAREEFFFGKKDCKCASGKPCKTEASVQKHFHVTFIPPVCRDRIPLVICRTKADFRSAGVD